MAVNGTGSNTEIRTSEKSYMSFKVRVTFNVALSAEVWGCRKYHTSSVVVMALKVTPTEISPPQSTVAKIVKVRLSQGFWGCKKKRQSTGGGDFCTGTGRGPDNSLLCQPTKLGSPRGNTDTQRSFSILARLLSKMVASCGTLPDIFNVICWKSRGGGGVQNP